MLEQRVGSSVCLASQFSVLVKRKVSASSNPFALRKRRDGIGLEFLKFFAHVFRPNQAPYEVGLSWVTISANQLSNIARWADVMSVKARPIPNLPCE
jgi:hypothetical protein